MEEIKGKNTDEEERQTKNLRFGHLHTYRFICNVIIV
jgi:hypothetical protein